MCFARVSEAGINWEAPVCSSWVWVNRLVNCPLVAQLLLKTCSVAFNYALKIHIGAVSVMPLGECGVL